MFESIINSRKKVTIQYLLHDEVEKSLCYILDYDDENKLIYIETVASGGEYIYPLSVIKQIYIEGTIWQYHNFNSSE